MAVKSKPKKRAPRKSPALNAKQELFCRYYTQNDALFGNATHSYAQAYGYQLDKLSHDDAIYEQQITDGVTRRVLKQASSYDRAVNVCSVEGARLLRNPRIQARKTELLNELLKDSVVDSQLAKVIMQDEERSASQSSIPSEQTLSRTV